MNKRKLLRTILIPVLGVSAITPIAVVATSCGTVSVESVTLDKTEIKSLGVNDVVALKATVLPENATDKTVTWSSENSQIASVDDNGNVKGMGIGNTTITVTTKDGNKKAVCTVTVDKIHPRRVLLDKTRVLGTHESEILTATVLPEDATNKDVTWRSSDKILLRLMKMEQLLV